MGTGVEFFQSNKREKSLKIFISKTIWPEKMKHVWKHTQVDSRFFKAWSSGAMLGQESRLKFLRKNRVCIENIRVYREKSFSQKPFDQECWNVRGSIPRYVTSFVQITIQSGRVGPRIFTPEYRVKNPFLKIYLTRG